MVHSLRYVSPGVLRLVSKRIVTTAASSGGGGAGTAAFAIAGKAPSVAMKAVK